MGKRADKKHHVTGMCDLPQEGRTERAWALTPRICPACVALNIVVFVYGAYNSHAKGHSIILTRREKESVREGDEQRL